MFKKLSDDIHGPSGSTGLCPNGPSLYEWFDFPTDKESIKSVIECEDDDRVGFMFDLVEKARAYRKKKYGSEEVNYKNI